MDDDWASDGDESNDLGDFAIPEISVPAPPSPPKPTPPPPVINAWTAPSNSAHPPLATRLRNAANLRNPPSNPTPAPANHHSTAPHPRPHRIHLPPTAHKSAPPGIPPLHNTAAPKARPVSSGPVESGINGAAPAAPSERPAVGRGPVTYGGGSGGFTVALFVSNLGPQVGERELAAFFAGCGVAIPDVRMLRGEGGGRAAVVTVRGEANQEMALAMHGGKLEGRNVYVKIEGTGRGKGYGFGAGKERGDAWGRGGGAKSKVKGEQRDDPSIPVGPTPAGRKKLMLKPRTKPMPVLEVDQRAIGDVKGTAAAAVGTGGPKEAERTVKGASAVLGGRKGPKEALTGGKWTVGRGDKESGEKWSSFGGGRGRGGVLRGGAGRGAGSKKDDDNKNRPVLLNNFAALEVNDSDV